MNIRFTARHFKATDEIRHHAIAAIERMPRFDETILSTEVVLTEDQKPTRLVCGCEFVVKTAGSVLTTAASGARHDLVIDTAAGKMERLLEKHKEKRERERVRKIKLSGARR